MAYNKKNWQDNVSNITAAELNRMEQGIYDNSLVVDAVTNTLNPIDTETYKTIELTEGQITDVIGVNDILIKGQISQNGEPTPSSPVDINVVSGNNTINISSKNLLKISNYSTQTINGVNLTFKNGSVSCSGTATANVIVNLLGSNLVLQQGTYTLSGCPNGGGSSTNYKLDIFKVGGSSPFAYDIGNSKTFTLSEQTTFDKVRLVIFNGKTVNNLIFKPQLEQASTATTYEVHQNKELPLNLPVENLFDKNNETYTNGYITGSGATTLSNSVYTRTLYIECLPNTTYAIQKMVSADNSKFLIASSVDIPETGVSIYNVVNGGADKTSAIYTTSNNAKYLLVTYIQTNVTSTTLQEMLDSIQIEKSSKVNAYTPYGIEPMELYKVGNYQDYFYKENEKWYLYKRIQKRILNGSESWGLGRSSSPYVFTFNITDYLRVEKNIIANTHFQSVINGIYGPMTDGQIKFRYYSDATNLLYICTTISATVSEFKTWLSNNNVTIYYVLGEPIITEITDITLKSQLEAIYNAPLYEQTNIIQTNNDLPMVLDITACKDNINGIKAFIRK